MLRRAKKKTPAKAGGGWIRKEKRRAIHLRDSYTCVYCLKGVEDGVSLTLDHLRAPDFGGGNQHWNLVTACKTCNSRKSKMSLGQFLKLLKGEGIDVEAVSRRIKRLTGRVVYVNGKKLEAK